MDRENRVQLSGLVSNHMNKPIVDHEAANPVDKTWKSHWSGQDAKPETRRQLRREKREAKRRLHKLVRRQARTALDRLRDE